MAAPIVPEITSEQEQMLSAIMGGLHQVWDHFTKLGVPSDVLLMCCGSFVVHAAQAADPPIDRSGFLMACAMQWDEALAAKQGGAG